MIGRVLACCVLSAVAAPLTAATAQTPATAASASAEALDVTFRDWTREHDVKKGVLVIGFRERQVLGRGYGGQEPGQRVLLASLSKAITGRCVAVLVADGRLRLDSTVGEVLAPFFKQNGEPVDGRIKEATVEQLLAHRGGFPAAPRDLMTPAAVELLQTRKSPATASPAELLVATLTAPLASAPGEAFRYSNVGYLVLGVMIETVSGESYERFCGREVLEWAGVGSPSLDRDWRVFSSFGGWSLSGPEYVALLTHDRLEDLVSGRASDVSQERIAALRDMMLDPHRRQEATGAPARWQPAWYGLGQYAAMATPPWRVAWHTGSWGVAPDTVGMQAVQHQRGTSWFVWYTPRPGKDATDTLLQRMTALAAKIAD